MKEFFIYLLKSGICISIFLIVYQLFMRRTTFLHFNRVYLVLGLIASFILPAFKYTYEVKIAFNLMAVDNIDASVAPETFGEADSLNYLWIIISMLYFAGIVFHSIRNIRSYRSFAKLSEAGRETKKGKIKIIDNKNIKSPFTVFGYIFINTENLSHTEENSILKHEITHVKQKHWIDLLLSECALLLQWFNPLMWLYVYFQKENHEFLADEAVLADGVSPALYQAVLINQQFRGPVFSFVNSFNYSNPLNRLTMMKKVKTQPWKRMAILTLLPAFGLFFWASANPHYVWENPPQQPVNEKPESARFEKSITYITDGEENSKEAIDKLYQEKGDEITGSVLNLGEAEITENENGDPYIKTTNVALYIETDENGDQQKDKKTKVETVTLEVKGLKGKPLYIIDNREATDEDLENLSANDIKDMDVVKDDEMLKEYGDKAKNGVVRITTSPNANKGAKTKTPKMNLRIVTEDDENKSGSQSLNRIVIRSNDKPDKSKSPLYILDGKEITTESFDKLKADDIDKINVLKDDYATQKYGEKGKYGVLEITTKKALNK